jgi:ferredoxin
MKGRKRQRWMRLSTVEFIREARRTKHYTLFDFVHGYVYARWPYLYIGIGTGEHRLSKAYIRLAGLISRLRGRNGNQKDRPAERGISQVGKNGDHIRFEDTYHGKVVPLESAKQLVMVQEDIRLENLEKVIPYAKARDLILKNPDHLIALECPCRAARPDPCLPLDVCLIIGEPFTSFVAEHHEKRSRWITSEEAVEILKAEDDRGHVHHAFFKDAMLGRFYAICNCCECCCGAMQAQRHGTLMLASSGYTCRVDETLCLGCGDCHPACQFRALSLDTRVTVVNAEKCMGCGVCVSRCEQGALELVRDPGRGEPLELVNLMNQIVIEKN